MIILPRQARDKHREKHSKRDAFCFLAALQRHADAGKGGGGENSKLETPASPSIRCHLGFPDIENRSLVFNIILSMVYQDRLGPDVTTRKLKEGACRVSYSWLTQLFTLKTSSLTTCKKPPVLRYHVYTKSAIVLPRQARDKHRENPEKVVCFLGAAAC
jgi:hypothetical protein